MVDTLEPYNKALKDFKSDLPKFLQSVIVKNQDAILYILTNDQLREGIDSSGKVVGTYKKSTEKFAEEDRQASGGLFPRMEKIAGQPFNFDYTGDLIENTFLLFEDLESFSLFSKDEKASMLQKEYGDIFTLTKENNKIVNQEILRPAMYEEMIRRLFI